VSTQIFARSSFLNFLKEMERIPFFKKKRYLILFLAFLGFINLYTLRVNFSVAIVALTQNRNFTTDNGTVIEQPYFDWSSEQKGYALGAFFYGRFFF
jgi:ACS family sodium-dependent inorganic phosphate cotransporter